MRYSINQKIVAERKHRSLVADLPTCSKDPTSIVLSVEDEAIVSPNPQRPLVDLAFERR